MRWYNYKLGWSVEQTSPKTTSKQTNPAKPWTCISTFMLLKYEFFFSFLFFTNRRNFPTWSEAVGSGWSLTKTWRSGWRLSTLDLSCVDESCKPSAFDSYYPGSDDGTVCWRMHVTTGMVSSTYNHENVILLSEFFSCWYCVSWEWWCLVLWLLLQALVVSDLFLSVIV